MLLLDVKKALDEVSPLDMENAKTLITLAKRVLIVGNGGSAAIASHIAIDLNKNSGKQALSFNDPATLTCLANDFGYEHVFSKQIEFHGEAGDVLIAISSSGKSENILNAVRRAVFYGMSVITFSGFSDDNPLRSLGSVNFYVGSSDYGVVEITHLSILHSMIGKTI